MKKKLLAILYPVVVLLIFVFAAWVIYFITGKSSRLDFRVFYGAATAAVHGKSIYTLFGIYMMPFWYFPWSAWLYAPFTLFNFSQAWFVYVIVCCAVLWGIINYYSNVFDVTHKLLDKLFLYSLTLLLCMMLFNFGQTDILVLGLATIVVILLEREEYFWAGIVLPLVLIKPHLLIVFVIACVLKGGKATFLGASIASLVMFGAEFLLTPKWVPSFVRLFVYGSQRNEKLYWGHTTLPRLLGFDENYVGTANIPIVLLLIVIGILVVWKFRRIPAPQLIALSLAASLFCAPRAFGYDLVLLIPAMLLISKDFNWKVFVFWILAISIPFAFNFSTGSYALTLLIFGANIWHLGTKNGHYPAVKAIQNEA